MSFADDFLRETTELIGGLDTEAIEATASGLAEVRERGGRLFILGVGGSAGHASHAVNDFRKLCAFEAYAPTDNVSELTARANDEGFDTVFAEWLRGLADPRRGRAAGVLGRRRRRRGRRLGEPRAGARPRGRGRRIGVRHRRPRRRPHGEGAPSASSSRRLFADRITPHTEGLCAVVWHLLVTHPALKRKATKWESVAPADGDERARRACSSSAVPASSAATSPTPCWPTSGPSG